MEKQFVSNLTTLAFIFFLGFTQVALTNFIPITLAELAYEQGHLYGTDLPCKPSGNSTPTMAGEPIPEKPRCMISFGSLEVDTASFVLYLTSLAVFLQVKNDRGLF